jgi:hypothetical protein
MAVRQPQIANFGQVCQVVRSIKEGEKGHERVNIEHGRPSVSVR